MGAIPYFNTQLFIWKNLISKQHYLPKPLHDRHAPFGELKKKNLAQESYMLCQYLYTLYL